MLAKAVCLLSTIRWAGAAYLVYLGLRLLLGTVDVLLDRDSAAPTLPAGGPFREAFIVTVGNPNAVCFFSSLFPQFFIDGRLSLGKAAATFVSTLAMTFPCMLGYASAGARI